MSIEVVKRLDVLLGPYGVKQRDYLMLRLFGSSREEAQKVVGGVDVEGGQFQTVEQYVMGMPEVYREQAKEMYVGALTGPVLFTITTIAMKGQKWEEVEKEDKPYVKWALDLLAELTLKGEGGKKKGYEEQLREMRKGKK